MSVMMMLGRQARAAQRQLGRLDGAARAVLIDAIAAALDARRDEILSANRDDMREAAASGLSAAMLDRLMLDKPRVAAMAEALREIAALPDPVGRELATWQQPNGLRFQRISVPLGVIGIIYESRPNVTADASAICLKAGNSVILRGGSESARSSAAIVGIVRDTLSAQGLDVNAVQVLPSQDRALVGELLSGLGGQVDVVVPRGGRALVERVQRDARVPVIGHLEGLCHVYLHAAAGVERAVAIVVNSKLRRTGVCGSAETLLIDRSLPPATRDAVIEALQAGGCEIRGCAELQALYPGVQLACDDDWSREHLDAIISARLVDDLEAAVAHIARWGSGHTESIVTEDVDAAAAFMQQVDSAIVMHNASTQFADGGEFGMGAEIGISTSRLHARGPVGAAQLTSYKYLVHGAGHVRPG